MRGLSADLDHGQGISFVQVAIQLLSSTPRRPSPPVPLLWLELELSVRSARGDDYVEGTSEEKYILRLKGGVLMDYIYPPLLSCFSPCCIPLPVRCVVL